MRKITVFALAAGMTLSAFPAMAQKYIDYHSDGGITGHANQGAYEQMMNSIDSKYAAEKPSNPTYLQREKKPVYDVGNYGDVEGQRSSGYDTEVRREPLASNGDDVFVSKEVNAAKKQRERDRARGHDSNYQPVR